VIGTVLGTLITVDFRPLRTLIRLYIELWRGLPILVTVFLVYIGLPTLFPGTELGALLSTTIALVLWGSAQVAEATRRAVPIAREQQRPRRRFGFGWAAATRTDPAAGAATRLLPPLVSTS
jgi:polar amino acid transport system permease protein